MISILCIFSLIGKGIISGFVYAVPVGPLGSIALRKTLEGGLKLGLVSFAGMAGADLIYIIVAFFGFSLVKEFMIEYSQLLKCISYSVILLIGIVMVVADNFKKAEVKKEGLTLNNKKSFATLFFLGLSNPVAFFVFINLLPILMKNTEISPYLALVVLSVGITAGMLLWWGSLIFLVNYYKKQVSVRRIASLQKVLGILIVFLASVSILASLLNFSF